MTLSEGTTIILGLNLIGWIVQFAVIKNDTSWIKKRLSHGDEKLERHDDRLNIHQAEIASIKSGCKARHPGTVFPSVNNGRKG